MDQNSKPRRASNGNVTIYIAYSYEDQAAATRLYNDLKKAGLNPWLDRESLLPGQSWSLEIKEAIRNSGYFIALFSTVSVQKREYIQSEFKLALNYLDENAGEVYIIPVRLDDCIIPYEKFRELYAIDLFPLWEHGLQKIVRAIGTEKIIVPGSGAVNETLKHDSEFDALKDWKWTELLSSINDKRIVPFIGAEARTPWIPNEREIAIEWAEQSGYPLKDKDELPHVSQFLALDKADDLYPKKMLSRLIGEKLSPDFSLAENATSIYRVLAGLNLPLYFTTNYDHFMEDALKSTGKQPVSEFYLWNEDLVQYTQMVGIRSVFEKGGSFEQGSYRPTAYQPLVYHFYGDFEVPQSMVLTERDHFDFNFNLSHSENSMLPFVVRRALAASPLLFIGYTINDINFKLMFRNLIGGYISRFTSNVAIFSASDKSLDDTNLTYGYLNNYARNILNSRVYWSTISHFSGELQDQWNTYKTAKATHL